MKTSTEKRKQSKAEQIKPENLNQSVANVTASQVMLLIN